LKIENPIERSFYEKQILIENWSIPELKRQKKSSLFPRLAAGKNKNEILQLSQQGKIISKPEGILKGFINELVLVFFYVFKNISRLTV
jgi:predicted nuclease of restriction endonuclease-like (RecB) superfamily